ncbi:hypothetical protein AB9E34_33685, partial [Rhizobium leguminosarum]
FLKMSVRFSVSLSFIDWSMSVLSSSTFVPGEFTPAFRERKFEVLLGNSGARLPDPFDVATQYAFNPDNSDEARLGSYYLWRT